MGFGAFRGERCLAQGPTEIGVNGVGLGVNGVGVNRMGVNETV